jgi:virginiamycin B lyase
MRRILTAAAVLAVAIASFATVAKHSRVLHAAAAADTVDVQIDEWLTPSKPPYPHDPAVAPDGMIWYTGQRANVVGRFDPNTQQFKEYTLPTPNSGPHGIIPDKAGNIWYTGNAAALIGKIDPKTGKITEFKMPDPKATDPHTMVFLNDGMMLFTVQAGNFVGSLDPKAPTGNIKLVSPPTANARPYGIRLNSKEIAFFDEFNAPNIGSIDPKTMKITEYPLPDKGARPRRIWVGKDDTVWYGDYARGYLGHLDPATRKVDEFKSPGGEDSKPYAILQTADGAIWYVETGEDTHNVLVRFNPSTKKFQTWPIPGGGGTVRNMDIDKSGNLWLAESGVGKLARVKIKSANATQ